MGEHLFMVEPYFYPVVASKLEEGRLRLIDVDPRAGVGHALLPSQGFEQIHYSRPFGIRVWDDVLPLHGGPCRGLVSIRGFGGEWDIEQSREVLAGLMIG